MEMEEDISSHLNSGSAAFRMSTLQPLREYINEQLAAAAEEIFRQVEKTFRQLEEELCRQHRLLGISWKPHLQLHNICMFTSALITSGIFRTKFHRTYIHFHFSLVFHSLFWVNVVFIVSFCCERGKYFHSLQVG